MLLLREATKDGMKHKSKATRGSPIVRIPYRLQLGRSKRIQKKKRCAVVAFFYFS